MSRRNSRRKRQKKRKVQELIKRLGTLNIVLICVFVYMMYINWKMLAVFSQCGSAPESAWCALIAALLGECGICGWIPARKSTGENKIIMSRLILVENIRGMQAIMKKWRTKNNDEF